MKKLKIFAIFMMLVMCFISPAYAATNVHCDNGDCTIGYDGYGDIVEYEGTKMSCSASATPIVGNSSMVIRVSVIEIAPNGSKREIAYGTLNATQQTTVIFRDVSINPGGGYKYRSKFRVISGSDLASSANVVVAITTW